MKKFITGKILEKAVLDIIGEAKKSLLIVSPYIKLDEKFENHFDIHINCPNVHILLVFGKNKNNVNKSMSKYDLDYFKKFTNISIIYVSNLHAKYYGNETNGLITSINLYDYSFKNNIEYGVYSKNNLFQKFLSSTDDLAWQTSIEIAQKGEVIFIKRPVYQNKLWFSILGKNYIKSDVLCDYTEEFYYKNSPNYKVKNKLNDFPYEIDLGSKKDTIPIKNTFEIPKNGYCIRTGKSIPFNPDKPYSYYAYSTWATFNNPDYKENYCHLTGKESNGETSMRKPIL
jgi:hypothetical protein